MTVFELLVELLNVVEKNPDAISYLIITDGGCNDASSISTYTDRIGNHCILID